MLGVPTRLGKLPANAPLFGQEAFKTVTPPSNTPGPEKACPLIVAATSARVIYGNERAMRDALTAFQTTGHTVELICRHEKWNDHIRSFFATSCDRTIPSPMCEFPLRGYYLKCFLEIIPRYVSSNYNLFKLISAGRRGKKLVVFIAGDSDALITFNLLLIILGVPVIFRCGAAPATHNFLRRLLLYVMKSTATRYVVDSNYMRDVLAGLGIARETVEVLRPMPPLR